MNSFHVEMLVGASDEVAKPRGLRQSLVKLSVELKPRKCPGQIPDRLEILGWSHWGHSRDPSAGAHRAASRARSSSQILCPPAWPAPSAGLQGCGPRTEADAPTPVPNETIIEVRLPAVFALRCHGRTPAPIMAIQFSAGRCSGGPCRGHV